MLINLRKVLLLNYSYEPIMVVSVKKALIMYLLNKADIIEKSDHNIRSLYLTIPVPYVIKLRKYFTIKQSYTLLIFPFWIVSMHCIWL